MIDRRYQVIVIGGGHAGAEAAWAAANLLPASRFGPRAVALLTLDASRIGVMSCNPAIGGLAKGQIVREIDALGGLMGLATDATGINFRVLNTSRGPAVHGPRAQCDKHAYAAAVRAMLEAREEIEIVEGSVEGIEVERGRVRGVVVQSVQRTAYSVHEQPGTLCVLRSTLSAPIHSVQRNADSVNEQPCTPYALRSTLSAPIHSVQRNADSVNEQPCTPYALRSTLSAVRFTLSAPAVVLTTGTFMRGLMHTGESRTPGGRFGEGAAAGISAWLREAGFELGRLKTGTPPRLKRSTIDWDALEPQWGDEPPVPFSELSGRGQGSEGRGQKSEVRGQGSGVRGQDPGPRAPDPGPLHPSSFILHPFPRLRQLDCRSTRTTPEVHAAIRENLHRAPMYSGQIESVGPRYCPSIEDKVVRFAQRESHGVYLEPESHADDWVYCNGISTSLPADVQERIVRGMPGCEKARIYRYGYAVEYDMVRPHQIEVTGQTKAIAGLFLAGQINGTSGYEEAAGQGLVAGVNAARYARGEGEFVLGREEAYIGVMMDDLVCKTPVEPYRMFTSRAEHRLLLRADNAPDRLTPRARDLGLLDSTEPGRVRLALFEERTAQLAALNAAIDSGVVGGVPLAHLARQPEFAPEDLRRAAGACLPNAADMPPGVCATVLADRKYAGYMQRQRAEIRRRAELEHKRIPEDADFAAMASLRREAREALARFRPRTFGQAGRLEGVTPADLTLLAILLRQRAARAAERAPG